jgi:hypothetical protein
MMLRRLRGLAERALGPALPRPRVPRDRDGVGGGYRVGPMATVSTTQ